MKMGFFLYSNIRGRATIAIMVSRIISYIGKEIKGLHQAAYMLAFFTLLSQILAFFRGRLLAGEFGAGIELDVFYAAFRIPDFMFVLLAAIVSVAILVPYLIKTEARSEEAAAKLINSVFTVFVSISIIILLITAFFTPAIAEMLFPKIVESSLGLEFIMLIRVMLISPFILGVSSLFGSILQAEKRFIPYALAPVFYNAGIIFGILYFYPKWGIVGLAWGVVFGAILHVLIQIPAILRTRYIPRLTMNFQGKELKEMLSLAIPRTLTYASDQFNISLLLAIAGLMYTGSVSIFSFAFMLESVPLALIGASYSLAAFPTLSKLYADGDIKKFVDHFSSAAAHIIFWSFPAIALLVVLRAQVVRTVFGTGEFNWTDTRLTAASLAVFAIAIVAQGLNLLFVRGFYAAGKTWRPFFTHAITTLIIAFSAIWYMNLFENVPQVQFFFEKLLKIESLPGSLVVVLPLAYLTGTLINCALLWNAFERQFTAFSDRLWRVIFHSFSASVIMGFVTYWGLVFLEPLGKEQTTFGVFLQGLGAGLIGIVAWVLIMILLGNREFSAVIQTLRSRIWKSPKPVIEEPKVLE